jgi:hypothetical protein
MIIHDVEQGSAEWLKLKADKFTGAKFGKLFMGKTTAGYDEAINEVVYGVLTGKTPEVYVNQYMRDGTEREPLARRQYEAYYGESVEQVGFVELNKYVGCSPDGLVGKHGMIEIKCPKYSTLINMHLKPKIDKGYYWQMQGGMWVCDREWCDYFVYHPDLEPYLERVERRQTDIAKLEIEVDLAIEEVNKRIKQLGGNHVA